MRYLTNPFQFFITSEFNFSLFGAIFGFLLVLFLLARKDKTTINKYIDGAVVAFLFVLIIGYIGSFFGGQVYGRETALGIEMTYSNPHSPVPYQVPVFPLPIVYTIASFLIFSAVYILSLFIHIPGYIGYIGLMSFSAMILILDSFSGKQDIVSQNSIVNFPQVFAIALFVWSAYRFLGIFREASRS